MQFRTFAYTTLSRRRAKVCPSPPIACVKQPLTKIQPRGRGSHRSRQSQSLLAAVPYHISAMPLVLKKARNIAMHEQYA